MKLCIDLCCGLGGFSQAFMDDPEWEVIRIDISKKLAANIIADVRQLPLKENLKPDVLLMSPPCERFSQASHAMWPKKGIRQALEIVGACLEAVDYLKPKYWMLENPKGRLRWFMAVKPGTVLNLGDCGYRTIKPTDLWGNIQLGMVPNHRINNGGLKFDGGPRNPSARSAMPYAFSKAVKEAVS